MLRMLAQQALGKLHHHIQPACRLQGGRTPDHSEDSQHHINRRFTGLQTKDKRQNKQTDTAYQPQSIPPKRVPVSRHRRMTINSMVIMMLPRH